MTGSDLYDGCYIKEKPMERPITVNLHESLKDVEDRSCLVMDDDGPFVQRMARALAASPDEKPAPPENPMSADRVRWEHIQRVYELCNHNVSETARRLNMHRRTLQRILAKRAPR